jgi:hypothetical protein
VLTAAEQVAVALLVQVLMQVNLFQKIAVASR